MDPGYAGLRDRICTMIGQHKLISREEIRYGDVPGNNLAALEGLPEELLDVIVAQVVAKLLAHVELPTQNLLVCQATRRIRPEN